MVPAMLPAVDLPELRDIQIPTADGDVFARFYRAPGAGPAPLLVFFHGGGWETGSVDVSDRSIRRLARESGVNVISVDYGSRQSIHPTSTATRTGCTPLATF